MGVQQRNNGGEGQRLRIRAVHQLTLDQNSMSTPQSGKAHRASLMMKSRKTLKRSEATTQPYRTPLVTEKLRPTCPPSRIAA
jgi:hypothetical protein